MESIAFDQYLEFKCVGGDCPYTCCGGGWTIEVDEKTDAFYKTCDGEFGEFLNKCVIRKDGKAQMGLINGRCALLSPDGLCNIQLAYGAEHLCDTCKNYPRMGRARGALYISYMTPSCPEVARELLERKQPLHMMKKNDRSAERLSLADDIRRRTFYAAIRLLQDREIAVAQRQRLFLLLNQAVQSALDANEPRTAEKTLAIFSLPEEYRKLSPEGNVPSDPVAKIKFLQVLAPLFVATEGVSKELPAIFGRMTDYLQDPTADLGAFAAYLAQGGEKKRQRAMENLLLGLLPAKYLSDFAKGNLYHQAVYVLMQAQLYRVFSAVGFAGGVAEEDATRDALVVSYISRYFDHARGELLEKVEGLMANTELSDMGFWFRLVG